MFSTVEKIITNLIATFAKELLPMDTPRVLTSGHESNRESWEIVLPAYLIDADVLTG